MTDTPKNDTPMAMQDPVAMLRSYLHNVIGCTLRGAMSSLPEVPQQILVQEMSRMVGVVIGETVQSGDLGSVLRFRADLKKQFQDGMDTIKPTMSLEPGLQR